MKMDRMVPGGAIIHLEHMRCAERQDQQGVHHVTRRGFAVDEPHVSFAHLAHH